jgi:anti-sigma B factor antagonist
LCKKPGGNQEITMLDFKIHNLGAVAVFHCTGQIKAGSETGLWEAAVVRDAVRIVVLDVAGVDAIDAAGLGALVGLCARAKATGKQLKLINLQPRVDALLRLTRLSAAFDIGLFSDVLDSGRRAEDPPRAMAKNPVCLLCSPEAA